jgi:hypothetical protein
MSIGGPKARVIVPLYRQSEVEVRPVNGDLRPVDIVLLARIEAGTDKDGEAGPMKTVGGASRVSPQPN